LSRELPALEAFRELQLTRAVALGATLMWQGDKNSAVKHEIRDLARRAYPEISEPLPSP